MHMKLYRIYTENKNLEAVLEIANFALEGYTVLQGTGYWKGKPEPCLVIEWVGSDPFRITGVAAAIKTRNQQETVLLTCQDIQESFV